MSPNHWSDQQLIDHLYGIGPADAHVETCADCAARLHAIQLSRSTIESSFNLANVLSPDWLAAQRRAIYRRIETEARRSWWQVSGPGWASAALAIALLGGGLAIHERSRTIDSATAKVTDSELAAQVSRIADDSEPQPAAPLEALFEN